MSYERDVGGGFEEIYCTNCDVRFHVPKGFAARRRSDGRYFYCPHGHHMAFTVDQEVDKLRRERDLLAQQIAQKNDDIREWKATADAQRLKLKSTARRTANGTCPCCNRTFSQLARHMANKHPAFVAEQAPGNGVAKH